VSEPSNCTCDLCVSQRSRIQKGLLRFAMNPARPFSPSPTPPGRVRILQLDSSATSDDLSVGDVFSPQIEKPQCRADIDMAFENKELGFAMKSDRPWTPKPGIHFSAARDGSLAAFPIRAPNGPAIGEKSSRRKKKKKHKAAQVEVGEAAPALSTIRGFTPMASGDEDSDISTAGSRTMSPRLAPTGNGNHPSSVCGGISALKLQLGALSLSGPSQMSKGDSETPNNAAVISGCDQVEVMTCYEVPLEHDFVSKEAEAVEKTSKVPAHENIAANDICKKMAARDFEPLTCLGKGTFGTVLLVRHVGTGRLYAQKQFRKASITVHKKLVEQTKTERMVLESVNCHPFVVKLYYAFQDHEKLYLILEYAQGGELFTYLAMEHMFSEDVASFYMAEMVLALEHLHQNIGVIYRDLKPENCLLDAEGHLLLTDFGLSKVAVNEEDRCNSSLGTIEYMAPEVIMGKPYGKACDWWSLGALAHDLLTGSPPFKANNHKKAQEKIIKQKLTLPYFLGPDAKDLLIRLLRKEPHKRLGYNMPKDLVTIKKHRFFRKIDWKALEQRELEPPIKPLITDPVLAENFSSDFTNLALSPVVTSNPFDDGICEFNNAGVPREANGAANETELFGGFSFVASSSLLNGDSGFAVSGCR